MLSMYRWFFSYNLANHMTTVVIKNTTTSAPMMPILNQMLEVRFWMENLGMNVKKWV